MRKRWILIPVTVGLLVLVFTGGALIAQGNNHPGGPGKGHALISRVAEILDLEESVLQSAFHQAIRERQDDRIEALLDRLAANERLTEDEATAIMQWFQARPDAAVYVTGVLLKREEVLRRRLNRMVVAGLMTRAEGDQVMDWYQDRPPAFPGVSRKPGERDFRSHGGLLHSDQAGKGARAFLGPDGAFNMPLSERTFSR